MRLTNELGAEDQPGCGAEKKEEKDRKRNREQGDALTLQVYGEAWPRVACCGSCATAVSGDAPLALTHQSPPGSPPHDRDHPPTTAPIVMAQAVNLHTHAAPVATPTQQQTEPKTTGLEQSSTDSTPATDL